MIEILLETKEYTTDATYCLVGVNKKIREKESPNRTITIVNGRHGIHICMRNKISWIPSIWVPSRYRNEEIRN